MDIGARLQLVRKSKGMSQRELAKRVGVTNSTISLIEQNKVSPSVSSLKKVLGPGEAYYFESRTPHRFRNVGPDDAIIVSANTPATF